jgi:hypothetical protein
MRAVPTRVDELHHLADATGATGWFETFRLDFARPDATIAGFLAVTLRPALGRSWCWACLTGTGRPLVAMVEDDAPLPRRDTLELRAPGLWLDVECETPGDHVTVGMEAFGVTFDDPLHTRADDRGDRIPVGLDLEWETAGDVMWTEAAGYEMACHVSGEVLVGDEQIELDGSGRRSHCWGDVPWWSTSSPAAPFAAAAVIPLPDTGGKRLLTAALRPDPHGARWEYAVCVG